MPNDSTQLTIMIQETIRSYRQTNPRECQEHAVKACGMHMVAAFTAMSKLPEGSLERVYKATVVAMADEVHKIIEESN